MASPSVAGRVGRGMLAEEMQGVGRAVEEASKAHAEDEDIAAEAPDEFLDPIMSHLMTDPVILPSSKVCVLAHPPHSCTMPAVPTLPTTHGKTSIAHPPL